jgi:hypothetical protein
LVHVVVVMEVIGDGIEVAVAVVGVDYTDTEASTEEALDHMVMADFMEALVPTITATMDSISKYPLNPI